MTHEVPKSLRSPLRKLLGVKILATGSYVPDQVIRNEDLAKLGYDADWIRQRTGILERRHAPPEMATSDMAIEASKRVMESAGVTAADIDLVLLGTFTPDMPMPATACIVQDRLGIVAPAMDLQAACAGFVYSMITAMQFVKTGCSQLALVITLALALLCLVSPAVSLLTALIDPERRALHDRLARTLVVHLPQP